MLLSVCTRQDNLYGSEEGLQDLLKNFIAGTLLYCCLLFLVLLLGLAWGCPPLAGQLSSACGTYIYILSYTTVSLGAVEV